MTDGRVGVVEGMYSPPLVAPTSREIEHLVARQYWVQTTSHRGIVAARDLAQGEGQCWPFEAPLF